MSEAVRAFAPASIGNLAVGFDCLGMCLGSPGDVVVARRAVPGDGRELVRLGAIRGDHGLLPRDAERNTATVAARALLEQAGRLGEQLELELDKGLALASGLGSSAASAVAAVVAVDALLGLGASPAELLAAALAGERAACGSAHPDNAAPSLLGGIVLVREGGEIIELPVPEGLAVAVVRPHLALSTKQARRCLPREVPLATAVAQMADLGATVDALHRGDLAALGRSVVDRFAEPARAGLIPGFRAVQRAALDAGALAASISGAGPSIFALCSQAEDASRVGAAMRAAFAAAGHSSDLHHGAVPRRGARVLGGDEWPGGEQARHQDVRRQGRGDRRG